MSRRADLPAELLVAPFRGSEAIAAGRITADRLRGQSWVRVVRDVYVWRELDLTAEVRATALQLVIPSDAVLIGRTAAWALGLWSPAPGRVLPLEHARPVDTVSGRPAGTSRRRLVLRPTSRVALGRQGLLDDVVAVGDAWVTSPARTCFDLVRERGLVEAVVVVDAFAGSGLLTLPEWDAYLRSKSGWPGVRHARLACELGTAYALSPGETRLRMIVVLSGFPEPWVNVPVTTPAGVFHPDLLLTGVPRPAGLEYDGAYHRARAARGGPASGERADGRLSAAAASLRQHVGEPREGARRAGGGAADRRAAPPAAARLGLLATSRCPGLVAPRLLEG